MICHQKKPITIESYDWIFNKRNGVIEAMSRIAIASNDGIMINEHFGKTKEFFIYEADEEGNYKLLERRLNPRFLEETPSNVKDGFFVDVESVLVAQIGAKAEQRIHDRGIVVLLVDDEIEKTLEGYKKRRKFILKGGVPRPHQMRKQVENSGEGCGGPCKGKAQ